MYVLMNCRSIYLSKERLKTEIHALITIYSELYIFVEMKTIDQQKNHCRIPSSFFFI